MTTGIQVDGVVANETHHPMVEPRLEGKQWRVVYNLGKSPHTKWIFIEGTWSGSASCMTGMHGSFGSRLEL